MRASARTRLFAVLGDPVAHSLSPRFQNAAFLAAGIDAQYVALRVESAALAAVIHTIVASGGGGNITIPFKEDAARLDALLAPRVKALGAANLFGGDAAKNVMLGNTDVDGVLAAIDTLEIPASAWLVLGTGGSARAVAGAAHERGVALAVRSRDAARANVFANWAASLGVTIVPETECAIAINATPLGLTPADALPLAPGSLPMLRGVVDLTYRKSGESVWAMMCRAAGMRATDGREVLLAQGAASWALWFPGIEPPIEVMRAALDGHLG
ncbi:MAG: hypothetical protein ABIZ70_10750 [Gemmatimonadales bacterium]